LFEVGADCSSCTGNLVGHVPWTVSRTPDRAVEAQYGDGESKRTFPEREADGHRQDPCEQGACHARSFLVLRTSYFQLPMKVRPVFVCQSCGSQSPKWLGRCPDCGEWNSFVEERTSATATV